MSKINNPEIVAAELTKAVIQKLDYGKDSGNADRIVQSALAAFEGIYKKIREID